MKNKAMRISSFFLMIIATIGCTESVPEEKVRPNIVWITSEDNSKHYMKLFDEKGIETEIPTVKKAAMPISV